MQYISYYESPLGKMLLAGDEVGLIGLWFEGQKYFGSTLNSEAKEKEIPLFNETKKWLDLYFAGQNPDFNIPLHLIGTPFQMEVWKLLCGISYGQTTTYGNLAKEMAEQSGLDSMSAQAIGGAVGCNPISIIVPCHRVVGANGKLTGYAGGIDKKVELLKLEHVGSLRGS